MYVLGSALTEQHFTMTPPQILDLSRDRIRIDHHCATAPRSLPGDEKDPNEPEASAPPLPLSNLAGRVSLQVYFQVFHGLSHGLSHGPPRRS